ncbi:hypothetical protein V8E52_007478 [Russula decolorans]
MSDQPRVSHFQMFFESALQDYERRLGITLANHPLAERLETCQSAESITGFAALPVLQEQAQAFSEFRESDMRSLKNRWTQHTRGTGDKSCSRSFLRKVPQIDCTRHCHPGLRT